MTVSSRVTWAMPASLSERTTSEDVTKSIFFLDILIDSSPVPFYPNVLHHHHPLDPDFWFTVLRTFLVSEEIKVCDSPAEAYLCRLAGFLLLSHVSSSMCSLWFYEPSNLSENWRATQAHFIKSPKSFHRSEHYVLTSLSDVFNFVKFRNKQTTDYKTLIHAVFFPLISKMWDSDQIICRFKDRPQSL